MIDELLIDNNIRCFSQGKYICTIDIDTFNTWLIDNGYMSGGGDEPVSIDHTGDIVYRNVNWDYTIDDFLEFNTMFNTIEIINEFYNENKKNEKHRK